MHTVAVSKSISVIIHVQVVPSVETTQTGGGYTPVWGSQRRMQSALSTEQLRVLVCAMAARHCTKSGIDRAPLNCRVNPIR